MTNAALDAVKRPNSLPPKWRSLRIADVITETVSGDWGAESQTDGGLEAVRVVRATDFDRARIGQFGSVPLRFLKPASLSRRRLKPGDLLVELSGGSNDQPTGRLVRVGPMAPGEAVSFSNFVRLINPDSSAVEPTYLAWFWEHLYRNGVTRVYEKRTTGIRNFKLNDFILNETIELPPLPEQHQIASLLDVLKRSRDQAEGIVASTRALKRSLMQHLFTYGPVSEAEASKLELLASEIGSVPVHWRIGSLAELTKIQSGMVDPRNEPYSEFTHVGPDNIESGSGRLTPGPTAKQLGLISGKYLFTDEDVLYSKIRPYLRKAALPEFTGLCSADMYPLRPIDDRLSRSFLFHYLLTDGFTAQAISFQDRTGIPKINRQQLGSIPIPIPPPAEQKLITDTLSAIDNKLDAEMSRMAAIESLITAALAELMTGARSLAGEVTRHV